MSDSVTPWTVTYHAPLSMGFSRQEYWSGLLSLSPEDLPDPGLNPDLPHCRQTLYHLSHQESPNFIAKRCIITGRPLKNPASIFQESSDTTLVWVMRVDRKQSLRIVLRYWRDSFGLQTIFNKIDLGCKSLGSGKCHNRLIHTCISETHRVKNSSRCMSVSSSR